MIPLLLIAIGLGAALTVYELSPRARAHVDSYVRAIRSANEAHQTADAHLETANAIARGQQQPSQTPQWMPTGPVQWVPTGPAQWVPMPVQTPPSAPMQPTPQAPVQPVPVQPVPMEPAPMQPVPVQPGPMQPAPMQPAPAPAKDVAVDHAVEAIEANRDAAKNTAEAAKNAQTEAQRQEAAQSAAKVLEREKKIAAALASLGVGQCNVRSYPGVTERTKDTLLAKLRSEGMAVVGDNPWNIDTHEYDVKLRAVWDPKAQVVKLIVTAGKGGYFGMVTCAEIWKKIDPIMKGVIG